MATSKAKAPAAPSEPKATSSSTPSAGKAELQARIDADLERGYRGVTPDPHPNEDYTFDGAAAGRSPSAAEGRVAQPTTEEAK
jgi:hypothetical protein